MTRNQVKYLKILAPEVQREREKTRRRARDTGREMSRPYGRDLDTTNNSTIITIIP